MARIRSIKPSFFRHEELFEAEKETGLPLRLAFAGLWTAADREGRFKWSARNLKLDCLPYDDVDFSRVLDALDGAGFIKKYEHDGEFYGFIPTWSQHQVINQREAKSTLPEPTSAGMCAHVHTRAEHVHTPNGVNIPEPLRQTVLARDKKCLRCSSSDDLTVDHIFPRSMGGTHAITNLRTLCRSCNSGRPVAGQPLIDDLAKDGLTLGDMQRMCMHVQTPGEGKGREGKGIDADAAASRSDPEVDYFRRVKEICGASGGGLGKKLLDAKNGSVPLARAAVEQASTKHDPREYLGAIIRGKEGPECRPDRSF